MKVNYDIHKDVIKYVVNYWSGNKSVSLDERLLNIYYHIPPHMGETPTVITFEILCELFDFSNVMIRTWKDQLRVFDYDELVRDMIVMDGGALNGVHRVIRDADTVLVVLIDIRFAILESLSSYKVKPNDWEYILGFNTSDPSKKLYILMNGFKEKEKSSTSFREFWNDANVMYNKIIDCVKENVNAGPNVTLGEHVLNQSECFNTYSKMLRLIHEYDVAASELAACYPMDSIYLNGSDEKEE